MIASLPSDVAQALIYDWKGLWARDKQLPPAWAWTIWLVLAGRGWGKTRVGAEWVRHKVESGQCKRLNLVAATAADVRDVMVEGESGILAISPPWARPNYEPSKRRLSWPQYGAIASLYSADEPRQLRGPQCDGFWADELSCLVAGTLVQTEFGEVPIEQIKVGDKVHTRRGLRSVLVAGKTADDAELYRVELSNGRVLVGTGNHPIYVPERGFVALRELTPGTTLLSWLALSSNGVGGPGIKIRRTDTTDPDLASCSTESCGKANTDPSQTGVRSITRTSVGTITESKISSACDPLSTCPNTSPEVFSIGALSSDRLQLLHIGDVSKQSSAYASSARASFLAQGSDPRSVVLSAKHNTEENLVSTTMFACAHTAGVHSSQTNTNRSDVARVDVVAVFTLQVRAPVFNLTVDDTEEYFAQGVLVHNCWRFPEAWAQLQFGFRLGTAPQGIVTTTPRATDLVKNLVARMGKDVALTRGTTYENRANLAETFFTAIIREYEGTRLGRQELNAEILDDNPGALWKRGDIDLHRVREAPSLCRIVVGIDPAVSSDETSDETGIVVAGVCDNGHGYVIDDVSSIYSARGWALEAVRVFKQHDADWIIAEVNNGGDLVEVNLRTVEREIPYKAVRASRGKDIRAEPIASLYERGMVHHVGCFAKLEDQMCTWDPVLDKKKKSPDRMDALVYALSHLMLKDELNKTKTKIVSRTRYAANF